MVWLSTQDRGRKGVHRLGGRRWHCGIGVSKKDHITLCATSLYFEPILYSSTEYYPFCSDTTTDISCAPTIPLWDIPPHVVTALFFHTLYVGCRHLMSATRIIGVHKMAGTALTVPAIKKHTATVIMAHGLGDRCAAFSPQNPLT